MIEKVPSLQGGGAFWFTDLTTPDELYIFPVLISMAFAAEEVCILSSTLNMCYVFTVLIEKARSFLPAQYKSTPGGKAYAATDDEYEQSTGCSDVPIINEHLQGINSSSHL
jgi:hypothetical protein